MTLTDKPPWPHYVQSCEAATYHATISTYNNFANGLLICTHHLPLPVLCCIADEGGTCLAAVAEDWTSAHRLWPGNDGIQSKDVQGDATAPYRTAPTGRRGQACPAAQARPPRVRSAPVTAAASHRPTTSAQYQTLEPGTGLLPNPLSRFWSSNLLPASWNPRWNSLVHVPLEPGKRLFSATCWTALEYRREKATCSRSRKTVWLVENRPAFSRFS